MTFSFNKKRFLITFGILVLLNIILLMTWGSFLPESLATVLYVIAIPVVPPLNFLTALIAAAIFTRIDKNSPDMKIQGRYSMLTILGIVALPYVVFVLSFMLYYEP